MHVTLVLAGMACGEPTESAGSKLTFLIIGALLTLLGAIIVQAAVTPAVQTRTRRRERWEEVLRELFALLADELPRAAARLRGDAIMDRMWQGILAQRDPGVDSDFAHQAATQASTATRESADLVGQLASRLDLLFDRLRTMHPKSLAWIDLRASVQLLRYRLLVLDGISTVETEDEADSDYDEQENARKTLLRQLTPIVDSQKPPPQRTVRQRWNTLRARLRRRLRRSAPS